MIQIVIICALLGLMLIMKNIISTKTKKIESLEINIEQLKAQNKELEESISRFKDVKDKISKNKKETKKKKEVFNENFKNGSNIDASTGFNKLFNDKD